MEVDDDELEVQDMLRPEAVYHEDANDRCVHLIRSFRRSLQAFLRDEQLEVNEKVKKEMEELASLVGQAYPPGDSDARFRRLEEQVTKIASVLEKILEDRRPAQLTSTGNEVALGRTQWQLRRPRANSGARVRQTHVQADTRTTRCAGTMSHGS